MRNEMPNFEQMESVIESPAKEYLKDAKDTLETAFTDLEASDIGKVESSSGVGWSFLANTHGEFESSGGSTRFDVKIELVDSTEYEGEMLGYAVSLKIVWDDGEIIANHTPRNFTEDVWVTDKNELKSRLHSFPPVQPDTVTS